MLFLVLFLVIDLKMKFVVMFYLNVVWMIWIIKVREALVLIFVAGVC